MTTTNDSAVNRTLIDTIFEQHHISCYEYSVLATVSYEFVVPLDQLVWWVLAETTPSSEYVLPTIYRDAITSCIVNGWLKILSPEDCALDAQRRQHETRPICSVVPYHPGAIDFPPYGAAFFQSVSERIEAVWNQPVPLRQATSYNTDIFGQVHIYSTSRVCCRYERLAIRRSPHLYLGEDQHLRIISNSPMTTIGRWWLTRWEIMPKGFHAVVWYDVRAE